MKGAFGLALGLMVVAAMETGVGRGAMAAGDTGRVGRQDPRAAIFVQRGCTACHAIVALGAAAEKDVGPDLTLAYADVINRYGMNLESFLGNPSGVMRMMLSAHLHLSVADRDSMVHVLETLYKERRADIYDGRKWSGSLRLWSSR